MTGGVLAGTLASCGTVGAAVARRSARQQPNVIIIMSDDHGYGELSCLGNPHLKTPNLDRLHGESTRLTNYHHSPVCTPTRASLMTGRYNYRTCAIDTYRGRAMMHPDEVTIAELFSEAGYKTGIFGKWHLGDCYPMRACDKGFQESVVHFGGGLGQPSDRPESGGYFNPVLVKDGVLQPFEGYCTDIFASEAIGFMERHKDRPFFLYLPTNAPHSPLIVDEKYAQPYLDMGLDPRVAKLYGMIVNLDENVGRVMDATDRLGLRENTIFIFTTDNGAQGMPDAPRFNAGMRGHKGTVYQGGLRVPFLARWPGKFAAGTDCDTLSAHIDMAPTLLGLCGISPARRPDFDGVSLQRTLLEPGSPANLPDRNLYFQWHRGDSPEPYNNACVRNARYKLVNGVELYDLESDSAEERDVSRENPEIVAQLRLDYEAWFADVSATRGYEPPAIIIGNTSANPVYLTLQDMRGGEAAGYGAGGFWKTHVEVDGVYDIRLRFTPEVKGGTAYFQLGGHKAESVIPDGASEVMIKGVRLYKGPGSVRAWANKPEPANAARFVDISFGG
ncbi:MAG TPA: arylsulfatase [Candidatus Hydrogenedentes bacterium]|nr:arylsulfatase [Candidatus Hydrogenedentota bacterium]